MQKNKECFQDKYKCFCK